LKLNFRHETWVCIESLWVSFYPFCLGLSLPLRDLRIRLPVIFRKSTSDNSSAIHVHWHASGHDALFSVGSTANIDVLLSSIELPCSSGNCSLLGATRLLVSL
jgi:hypothetical protein